MDMRDVKGLHPVLLRTRDSSDKLGRTGAPIGVLFVCYAVLRLLTQKQLGCLNYFRSVYRCNLLFLKILRKP